MNEMKIVEMNMALRDFHFCILAAKVLQPIRLYIGQTELSPKHLQLFSQELALALTGQTLEIETVHWRG